MVRTRSKKRQNFEKDDEVEIETKIENVDDDDGSSSDEAPEMVVQSDAKELERRRLEMEHMQKIRYVFSLSLTHTLSNIILDTYEPLCVTND